MKHEIVIEFLERQKSINEIEFSNCIAKLATSKFTRPVDKARLENRVKVIRKRIQQFKAAIEDLKTL